MCGVCFCLLPLFRVLFFVDPFPLFCFFRCLRVLVGPFPSSCPRSDLRFPLASGPPVQMSPFSSLHFSCFLFCGFSALPLPSVGMVLLSFAGGCFQSFCILFGWCAYFLSSRTSLMFFIFSFLRVLPWAVVSCYSGSGQCVLLCVSLATVLRVVSSAVFLLCLLLFLPSLLWPGLRQ